MLWLKPWAIDDYPNKSLKTFTINPFILSNFLQSQDESNSDNASLFVGSDEDANRPEGPSHADWDPELRYELDWSKITLDPRYSQENASWRRMIPVQPRIQIVFDYGRPGGKWREPFYDRDSRKQAFFKQRLGKIYTEVALLEENPCTLRTKTVIRGSRRFGRVLAIMTDIKPVDSSSDHDESYEYEYAIY